MRLDQRLRELRPDLSWSRIRSAIERGQVTVDDIVTRDPAEEVEASHAIVFDQHRPALRGARLDLSRLYEDEGILVVDKPAGLLTISTHPEARATEDTVLRRAQEYARRLRGPSGYAGMLHRLDRDTSGALAIALSRDAHRLGRELFAAHEFHRWYLAVVHGVPLAREGTIDAAISDEYVSGRRRIVRRESEGRHAVTHYRVRHAYRNAALLELRLETGRQHQIRLHLQKLGYPIIGERVYRDEARRPHAPRQMLHAWRLEFRHPRHRAIVKAEAPVPPDMATLCASLSRQAQ
jgi:23S rRNA pseudouridine1911/1915/1917 synthase